MANIVPGTIWQPVDVGNRAKRRKGRGLVGHVAVSSSPNLRPGPLATRPGDWHFYLPKVGPAIQQIDLDLQAWTSGEGNASLASFESEGGLGSSAVLNAEPWSEDQIESAAKILAYMNETEGVPIQDMVNSLPTSRGFGVHRYGITHSRGLGAVPGFRIGGGESWSSVRGKECPGNAKVAQVPVIVGRAHELRHGSAPRPIQTPATPAPPAGIPAAPGLPGWSLPRAHYYGHIKGPAASHGGYYASERPAIQAIQRRFIAAGCVPGISDWRSGWADGLWEDPTSEACRRWFARYRPGQPYTDRIYADDYAVLGR